MSGRHAGDKSPSEAMAILRERDDAQLIDVRTRPEWMFVGTADTSETARDPIMLEWQRYPHMDVDPAFADRLEAELEARGAGKDAPLLFLCRSGARSAAAASLMTERGYTAAHNVAGGFEGNPDANGHRGKRDGWKADGLPWRQG